MYPLNDLFMRNVEQIERELRNLSQAAFRRSSPILCLARSIPPSQSYLPDGKPVRLSEPQGS
jgi:hypothetical protein